MFLLQSSGLSGITQQVIDKFFMEFLEVVGRL